MGQVRGIMLNTMDMMQTLAGEFDTKQDLFDAVSRQSGVSESMVRKLYYGQKSNPSVEVLDKLIDGIEQLS